MTKDKTVVSMLGGPIYQVDDPNPYVVEMLEDMLERARAGKIIGLIAASVDTNGHGVWERAGKTGGFSLVGALSAAQSFLTDRVNHGAE